MATVTDNGKLYYGSRTDMVHVKLRHDDCRHQVARGSWQFY